MMPRAGQFRRSSILPRPIHLGASAHTMVGPGGKIVEPRSESKELLAVVDTLEELSRQFPVKGSATGNTLRHAITRLLELEQQVAAGYHRNPGKFSAGEVVGQIGKDVHEVRYTHAQDGENYRHEFAGEVEVWAVKRNGKRELLLSHKRGLPLWDDF